jgi:hypothetical protein
MGRRSTVDRDDGWRHTLDRTSSTGSPASVQADQPPAISGAPRHPVSFERFACWQR